MALVRGGDGLEERRRWRERQSMHPDKVEAENKNKSKSMHGIIHVYFEALWERWVPFRRCGRDGQSECGWVDAMQ
ncbi:unnamed protein product [Fusarium venenatum]|uniref:Uncharacterized protein n=1 Tax=Fusarium venenatum TaxID=56646 RepID=A0A2L2TAV5_9HYPO|nr:uncharacterized protein FVRRES_11333 [Fusarium venenatum]CEI38642.1 unnamed protein product [Fusarium venenatum]